jgi:transcription termination/antitermination protein NusG
MTTEKEEKNIGEEKQSATPEHGKKKWFILQAVPGKEAKMMEALKNRIDGSDLRDKFGRIMMPTEEVVEMKGGKKRKSERKLFPGYIFVEMEMNEETWHLVKEVPNFRGFVGGTSDKPTPLSDIDANKILYQVEHGKEKPVPKVIFEPGEVVRITEGPFADFDGVVEDVNYEKNRLRVSVLIFGRSTPVELEFGQVKKS